MLSDLLAWWVRQLAGLLPEQWRGLGDSGAATVVALCMGGPEPEVEIFAVGRRGTERYCRVGLDETGVASARAALAGRRRPAPVVLRLPEPALLEREVVLPLAAERDPDAVLGYEMDRLTPFRAADVAWKASAIRRDRARGRLSLRLSVVPRALFADALPALARMGLVPEAIEAPAAAGLSRIGLARDGAAARRARRRSRLALAFVGTLAVAAVAIPFVRQSLASHALGARIAVLRPQVEEAGLLRARIEQGAGEAGAFEALAAQVGSPLATLAALTDILPDDTYLESLTLAHRRLVITGRTAAAARLIGLLAASPLIGNPAFAGPVTRTPQGGDAFTIRAEIVP